MGRTADWLLNIGVREVDGPIVPIDAESIADGLHGLTPANRTRLVYNYLTSLPIAGGLGIREKAWDGNSIIQAIHIPSRVEFNKVFYFVPRGCRSNLSRNGC